MLHDLGEIMTGREDIFQRAMNQGNSAAWDQLWDQAAAHYRTALAEFPDRPQALTNLGLALYELRKYEESILCYQKAARFSPDDPIPVEKIAQLYERLGNLDQGSKAAMYAAELYVKNRDVNKAVENWLRSIRLDPQNLAAHTRLALVYERTGEKHKAVTEYLAVASLLQSAGDQERAIKSVTQALQVVPNSPEAAEALVLLRDQKPLPKPTRPRGGTAPLQKKPAPLPEASQAESQTVSQANPVEEAHQNALSMLAEVLFDAQEEKPDVQTARRGLQSIMSGTGLSLKQPERSRIALHLGQVVDLQMHGQNAQAAEELERAMEAGLDHPGANFDLGYLYAQDGRFGGAIRQLQHAVQKPELTLGARLLLGDILRKMNRMKEASLSYMEALKVADAQVVASEKADQLLQLYDPLIEAQSQQSDPKALEKMCDIIHGLLMRPDWRANILRARQQLPAKEGDRPPIPLAEILFEAHSSEVVDAISYIYQLARDGYFRSAMEEAFYTVQLAPTYLPLHTQMGELLLKQNRISEAIDKFMVIARTYSTRGEPRRAVDMYQRIIELAPMDLDARACLIDQFIAIGEIEAALTEYINLAEVHYNLANLDPARQTYAEALRLAQNPKVDRAWRVDILKRMSDIDLQSLDWRQAMRNFEQIRTLQPDDESARSSLIELNLRLGQEIQALTELDNFIAFLVGSGQRPKAISFVEGLVNENPLQLSIRRRLADLYHQAGRDPEAVSQLDALGEALLQAGDRDGAIKTIEAILALNPSNKADYEQLLATLKGD
jgi:tetratricopeptide (TPR) repeat protein